MGSETGTLIKNIEYRHGAIFTGEYRIRYPRRRVTRSGAQYVEFNIEDASGRLKGYAWDADKVDGVGDLDIVQLKGQIREFNNSWVATTLQTEELRNPLNPLHLIPHSMCPQPLLLERLDSIVAGIRHDALRQFVFSILTDDAIALPFVASPASRNHHHGISGGLLEHSLECSDIASRFVELGEGGLDLAVVGALFHDIGKIRTIKSVGKLSALGYIVDHDSLTLEVLSPHIQQLDRACPDAAIALRYIWTWKNRKRSPSFPITTVAEVVATADRISTGLNVEEEAFRNEPAWRNFGRFRDNHSCWRPIITAYNI